LPSPFDDREIEMRVRLRQYRVELLLAALVLAVVGPLIHEYQSQQASRYVLTAAIWDHHTVQIDRYAAVEPPVLGIDRAVRGDHTYSDKAPLQPVLAVPFYAAYRAVGGESALVQRLDENLGVWWITLWMSSVPAAILAVLMYRFARRYAPGASLAAALGLLAGSMLLPFGAVLFGHELAALFAFAGFVMAASDELTSWRLVASGCLIGAAVATEYPVGIAAIVLGGYVVYRAGARAVWWLIGGVPAAVGLALYHTAAFGSPLNHPYRFSAFSSVTEEARPFLSLFDAFQPGRLLQVFFEGRGYVFAAPLVLIGLAGLILLARRNDDDERAVAITALVMFGAFLLIPLFWGNPWGGHSPGPRYMTPALPFVAAGVAVAWPRMRNLAIVAAGVGVATMGMATLTEPLIPGTGGGLGTWVNFLVEGDTVPTVFTIAIGPLGWIVHIGLAAWAGWALLLASRQTTPDPEPVAA
jgi:hypothetical protein